MALFLTIRDGTIYYVHQSAKDHLTSNEEAVSAIFPSGSENTHLAIFSRSIQAMEEILRANIYQLSHFDNLMSDDVHIPDPDPLNPAGYCCLHWVTHLCEGIASKTSTGYQNSLADNGALDMFIRKHLLHWLESLSILRNVSHGVISVIKLVALLKVSLHVHFDVVWQTNLTDLGTITPRKTTHFSSRCAQISSLQQKGYRNCSSPNIFSSAIIQSYEKLDTRSSSS